MWIGGTHSIPSADSPRYGIPITITESRTVRAVSVVDGVASAVVSARFEKRARPPNLVINGEFDDSSRGWHRVVSADAAADALELTIDDGARLSGPHSAKLSIRKPTGTVYHLRLTQSFQARPAAEYTLSFRAVADAAVRCRVGLQARAAPHNVLAMHTQTIGSTPRRYTLTGRGPAPGDAVDYLVQFDLGAAENERRTLWIDDVRLIETVDQH